MFGCALRWFALRRALRAMYRAVRLARVSAGVGATASHALRLSMPPLSRPLCSVAASTAIRFTPHSHSGPLRCTRFVRALSTAATPPPPPPPPPAPGRGKVGGGEARAAVKRAADGYWEDVGSGKSLNEMSEAERYLLLNRNDSDAWSARYAP